VEQTDAEGAAGLDPGEALVAAVDEHLPLVRIQALCVAGERALLRGDRETAASRLGQALADADAVRGTSLSVLAVELLAPLDLVRGDLDGVARHVQRLHAGGQTLANPYVQGLAELRAGDLARARQDGGSARPRYDAALGAFGDLGARPRAVDALEGLAGASAEGDPEEACRIFAAAAAERDRLGYRLRLPHAGAWHTADLEQLRAVLGRDGFAVAWAAGAALTLEQAVAYARRTRGRRGRPSSGWESLTPTESEVVALVCDGLTNPQIAARLFMARDTVKSHLAHVFVKVGVTSRSELAAQAARRNLPADH
jgi:DNA-binding CsgD family transcriptional regulator